MLSLGLALSLATLSIASFPCWHYSRRWGYVPCTTAAILLFFVATITAGGRPAGGESTSAPTDATPPTAVPAPPSSSHLLDSSRQPIPLQRDIMPVDATTQAGLQ